MSSNENNKTNTQARPKSAAGSLSARHALPEGAYLDEKPVEGGGKTFEQLLAENLGGEAMGRGGGVSPRKPVKR